jgi:hypothetical protein
VAADPVDLLKLTGGTATGRRLAGYAVGAVAVVAVVALMWTIVRWLRR